MNDDAVTDLKQFITATVTQQTAEVRQDIQRLDEKIDNLDHKLEEKIGMVEQKIDDLSAAVAEALDVSNETAAKQLKDHERRITKLEHKAAR